MPCVLVVRDNFDIKHVELEILQDLHKFNFAPFPQRAGCTARNHFICF